MFRYSALVASLFISNPVSLAAQDGQAAQVSADTVPPVIAASAFAKRSPFTMLRVSPDGAMIATRARSGGKEFVALIDASTQKLVRRYAVGEGNEIGNIRWAGSNQLLISLVGTVERAGDAFTATRLAYVHTDTGRMELLGDFGTRDGDNVIFVAEDGSYALVSVQRLRTQYPTVMRYDFGAEVNATIAQYPIEGVWNWYADEDGVVRLGLGRNSRKLLVHYRSGPDAKFRVVEKIKDVDVEDKYLHVTYIRAGSDLAYALTENGEGRVGLYTFDLATREPLDLIYENPHADIESVLFRDGKPVGVFWTGDSSEAHWLDANYEATYSALSAALSEEQIWIASRSEEDDRLVVWAGGAADPGAYYVFTPGEGRLSLLMESRPDIDERQLAQPKAIGYTARDGTEIRAILTLPKGREPKDLPLIILPHGGPFGVHDTLDYSDEVQLLANRGYAVLQPNFRGSGGYGEKFVELGYGQIGRAMQDDLDDAMDWAVAEGIADKDRVCLVGASYGGYASLWGVLRNPERYRCAASFAGVTDWDLILKHDDRFFMNWASQKHEEKIVGEENFDLDTVSPYRLAESLSRPVLIAQGKDDTIVPWSQHTKFRSAVKKSSITPVELVFEDEGHGFDEPENEQKWFEELTAFLAEHNPPD